MSYAIIRNEKLTRAESYEAYVHNDRKAKNHSNKDIDPTRTHLNFYFKENETTYIREFDNRKRELEKEFKEKTYDMEYEYKSKVRKLEKENSKLHRIIDKFYETIDKFIHWICEKFDITEEDNLIRDFEKETHTFIDPEKQIKHEEREKKWDLER